MSDVYVTFIANVNPATVNQLLGLVSQQANAGVERLHLLLSSNGGEVHAGVTAYNMLKAQPFELHTYNVGNVDSIATVMFLAGEKRTAAPRSSFLFHGVGMTLNGSVKFHEASLNEQLESLRKDQRLIGDVITDRTHIDSDEVINMFARSACVAPDDAVAKGIVHDVADVVIPKGATHLQMVFT